MVASAMHVCIFSDFLVITYSLFNDKKGKKKKQHECDKCMDGVGHWATLTQRSNNFK